MAIEFMTGDSYHSDADVTPAGRGEQFVRDGWWADAIGNNNSPWYYPAGGPFGTGAWAMGRYANENSRMYLPSAVGTTYLFAAWFWHGGTSGNNIVFTAGNGSNMQTRIDLDTTNFFKYYRGSTYLGSTTGVFQYSRWHHFALKVYIHDSAGTVDIELDGNNILALTSQDTYEGTAGAEITYIEMFGADDRNQRWSQPIVWSATGDAPTDFFGPHKIWTLRPNGDSATADWTPLGAGANYVEVDEAEADDDTSYVESGVSADEDRLDCESLPNTPDAIYAVQSRVLVKQTDAGTLGLKNGVYAGTTKTVSAERKCSLGWDYHTNLFTLNPDDAAAWAEADVNAAQLIYEVG